MAERTTENEQSAKSVAKPGNGSRGPLAPARAQEVSPRYSPLGRLRWEFDRLFDDFYRGWQSGWGRELESAAGVEVKERDDAVVVRADAPGFEAGDFDVQIRGDSLVMSACQSGESTQDDGFQWHKRELYHSIPLPAEVQADKIDARYRNGVLTITLLKTAGAKARKIEVKG
jgi:HSP20 family protein